MTVEKLHIQCPSEYLLAASMSFGQKYVLGEADLGTLFLVML